MCDAHFLVLVGTKAQFIKTAPILLEMDRRGVRYELVYTGQHSETFDVLETAFGTRGPDDLLVPSMEASTRSSFASWVVKYWLAVWRRLKGWKGARAGLVHGDTASTLFGALALRLARVPVVHVEAGLRSSSLLDPFPEEIVRRWVSRLAYLHLAPDQVAVKNLAGAPGQVVDTGGNTLKDSLRMATERLSSRPEGQAYAVASMHRSENLGRRQDLDLLLEEIIGAAAVLNIVFVLHPATREKIKATGWLERLQVVPGLELRERMSYPEFVQLLVGSCFLLTDGGSNQEEAAMLGLPTLLLRRNTERPDGLGDGIVLSRLDRDVIRDFVRAKSAQRWRMKVVDGGSPSEAVVSSLIDEFSP